MDNSSDALALGVTDALPRDFVSSERSLDADFGCVPAVLGAWHLARGLSDYDNCLFAFAFSAFVELQVFGNLSRFAFAANDDLLIFQLVCFAST